MDKQKKNMGGSGISSTDRISGMLCRVRDYIYPAWSRRTVRKVPASRRASCRVCGSTSP